MKGAIRITEPSVTNRAGTAELLGAGSLHLDLEIAQVQACESLLRGHSESVHSPRARRSSAVAKAAQASGTASGAARPLPGADEARGTAARWKAAGTSEEPLLVLTAHAREGSGREARGASPGFSVTGWAWWMGGQTRDQVPEKEDLNAQGHRWSHSSPSHPPRGGCSFCLLKSF